MNENTVTIQAKEGNQTQLPDISSEEDIKKLVDTFYDSVNADELLGPIFNNFAKVNWEHHLPQMYDFWSTLLFATTRYKGRPFPKHLPLPINSQHFQRWISLFVANVDKQFAGPVAEQAKYKAQNIAQMFQYKMSTILPVAE